MCTLVVVAYGLTRGDWLNGFLAGLTLAMAMMPEEFPAVLAVFLALGAWRIAQQRVLTRRVPAIETLGAATVLCVDKTGTLTLNQMSVQKLCVSDGVYDVPADPSTPLPEAFHELVEFGVLASQRDPFDPMEKAFHLLGARLADTEHLHPRLASRPPISAVGPVAGAVARVAAPRTDTSTSSPRRAHRKRSPTSATSTAAEQRSCPRESKRWRLRVSASSAWRGHAFSAESLPGEQHDFEFECMGLAGLADPGAADCAGRDARSAMPPASAW